MSKIKVKISETKYHSFYKTLGKTAVQWCKNFTQSREIGLNKPIVLVQYEKLMLSTPNKKIIFFKFIFFLGGRPRIQERTGQEKERKARKDDQEK